MSIYRKSGDEVGAGEAYKSQDERDLALEGRYRYDRCTEGACTCKNPECPEGDWRSTMGFVSAHQDELALEYLDVWRPRFADNLSVRDALPRFETFRFGQELDPAPHGILKFAVLQAAYPNDSRFKGRLMKPLAPRQIGPATLQKAVGRLSEAMTMPKPDRMTNYERNERESEVISDAQEWVAEDYLPET